MVRPPVLQPGDTIGVVAPGSPVNWEALQRGVERLEGLGYTVKLGETVRLWRGHTAGTDEQRAADINRMWTDPEVDAIMSARWGWGSQRVLPLLDWEAIRRTPKGLTGYSDVTILLNAINRVADLITFHGPMVASWGHTEAGIRYNTEIWQRAVTVSLPMGRIPYPEQVPAPITLVEGTARGRLVGGNLSSMVSLIATPWEPQFAGRLVFLEEGNEPIYKVDRMLTHLLQTGKMNDAAGFFFGYAFRLAVRRPFPTCFASGLLLWANRPSTAFPPATTNGTRLTHWGRGGDRCGRRAPLRVGGGSGAQVELPVYCTIFWNRCTPPETGVE